VRTARKGGSVLREVMKERECSSARRGTIVGGRKLSPRGPAIKSKKKKERRRSPAAAGGGVQIERSLRPKIVLARRSGRPPSFSKVEENGGS